VSTIIFLPVKPASAAGPPTSNLPEGFITIFVSTKNSAGTTFFITFSIRDSLISSFVTEGSCYVDIRILYILLGFKIPFSYFSYSTTT
jgi:hypothetical protein